MLNLCSLFKHSRSISIYLFFFSVVLLFFLSFSVILSRAHTHIFPLISHSSIFESKRNCRLLLPFFLLLYIKQKHLRLHFIWYSFSSLSSLHFFFSFPCYFFLSLSLFFIFETTKRNDSMLASCAHIYFEVTKMAAGPKES